jgi:hypothetical protein
LSSADDATSVDPGVATGLKEVVVVVLVELLTADERLACECLFGLAYKAVAEADGHVDEKEFTVFEGLLQGAAADDAREMLPLREHAGRGSLPDLARELLASDKGAFAQHVAATGSFAPGTDIENHLQAFVDRATGPEDYERRVANARGVIFEAIFFGMRTGWASGGLLGSKISRDESAQLMHLSIALEQMLGGTALGITAEDMVGVLKYQHLTRAAW